MAYVYTHTRLDTNEIFYVGIGYKKNHVRAYQVKKRNKHWTHIATKTEFSVKIVKDDISWQEAQQMERELIKKIGRKDLGAGPLCNWTDGGQGSAGALVSEETRRKITAGKTGKKRPPITDEARRNLSIAMKATLKRQTPPGAKGVRPKNFEYLHSPEIVARRIRALKGTQSEATRIARINKWTGPTNPNSKMIIHNEYGIFYLNLNEAWIASGLKTSRSMFSMMLLGIRKNKTKFQYA